MQISAELIRACKKGESRAQKELYVLLLPYLRAVARRYLFQETQLRDVLQDAFVKIFKSIKSYDSTKGEFRKWAVMITINTSHNANRKAGKMQQEEFIISKHDQAMNPEVFEKMSKDDLLAILSKMPTDLSVVFQMFCIDGFDHDGISEVLQIKTVLSRKRLSRARKWLKEYFVINKDDQSDLLTPIQYG